MLHKRRSFGMRKVSPPQPTCMTDEQKATYLKSLRNDRPIRPTGSRPLPARPAKSSPESDAHKINVNTVPKTGVDELRLDNSRSNRFSLPNSDSFGSLKGRPLVPVPSGLPVGRKVTPPDVRYRESTFRQKEKSEAQSLRKALEEMDLQDEETRIHKAAQLEAANLVWEHRNPGTAEQEKTIPYRNPDLTRKSYVIRAEGSTLDREGRLQGSRNVSGSSTETSWGAVQPLAYQKRSSTRQSWDHASGSGFNNRSGGGNRKASSGSSKGIFRNPDDEIYEEPQLSEKTMTNDSESGLPLRTRSQNPLVRGDRPPPEKAFASLPESRFGNANRNAPLRSRNAQWQMSEEDDNSMLEIRSPEIRAATSMRRSERSPKLPTPTAVSDKLGRPIVSFDPSWKPTQGSAQGNNFQPRAPQSEPVHSAITITSTPDGLDHSLPISRSWDQTPRRSTETPIPIINLPDDEVEQSTDKRNEPRIISQASPVPTIAISSVEQDEPKPPTPGIIISSDNEPSRPLPMVTVPSSRERNPTGSNRASTTNQHSINGHGTKKNGLPWISRHATIPTIGGSRAATVGCSACKSPIAGRIVTASGANDVQKARFHPKCFRCYHCGTGLECVSFYPEPDSSRLERLGDEVDQESEEADLRFYCHLDYHDLFSPRCGSCHTPIEGVVIVAAGKSWHDGHFFCAECGDPFSSTSPFVESQGYAYCVGCHTKRTSARCKACKKQILDDITVEALGGKWHEECFRCDECGDDFGEEGKFFVREVDIELTEKEKRKGLNFRKVEERAVCNGCEARRLKSRDVAAFL